MESSNTNLSEKNISLIVSQTNYTTDIAKEKLKQHNDNIVNVIEEYLNIEKPIPKETTTNQKIYNEIRNFIDTTSKK